MATLRSIHLFRAALPLRVTAPARGIPRFTGAPLAAQFSTTRIVREKFLNADEATFQKRVDGGGDKPVLVDFYADWCGPCRMLSPILEKLTSDPSLTGGKAFDLMTVDTEKEIELAKRFKVTALPTVYAFKNGQLVDKFIGLLPEPQIKKWIEKL